MNNANKVRVRDILIFKIDGETKRYEVGEIINPLTMLVEAYDIDGGTHHFKLPNSKCRKANFLERVFHKRRWVK